MHDGVNELGGNSTLHDGVNEVGRSTRLDGVNEVGGHSNTHVGVNEVGHSTMHGGVNEVAVYPTMHDGVNVVERDSTRDGGNVAEHDATMHDGVTVDGRSPVVHDGVSGVAACAQSGVPPSVQPWHEAGEASAPCGGTGPKADERQVASAASGRGSMVDFEDWGDEDGATRVSAPSTSSTDTPGPSHQAVLGLFAEASLGADFLRSLDDPEGEFRQGQLRAQQTLARSRALPPFDFESAARWREQQYELALGQAS